MARILLMGRLGDLVEQAAFKRPLPDRVTDTSRLRDWLDGELDLQGALQSRSVRVAVNADIVIDPHPVTDADEIAFLPPVGGG